MDSGCVYLMVVIIRKKLKIEARLYVITLVRQTSGDY